MGGSGNNSLNGDAGIDEFLFRSVEVFSANTFEVDKIINFTKSIDKIVLRQTSFNAIARLTGRNLKVENFVIINDLANELSLVGSGSVKIVYNLATENLFYNQNWR